MNGELLNNLSDFNWYKARLDTNAKYYHKHYGEPKKYPCRVLESIWEDDPNGPYSYTHTFIYQQEVECPTCHHKELVWPQVEE